MKIKDRLINKAVSLFEDQIRAEVNARVATAIPVLATSISATLDEKVQGMIDAIEEGEGLASAIESQVRDEIAELFKHSTILEDALSDVDLADVVLCDNNFDDRLQETVQVALEDFEILDVLSCVNQNDLKEVILNALSR